MVTDTIEPLPPFRVAAGGALHLHLTDLVDVLRYRLQDVALEEGGCVDIDGLRVTAGRATGKGTQSYFCALDMAGTEAITVHFKVRSINAERS